ncbi:Transferase [Penicillium concentricum]|uniref:Transferase n=1 Tax=Penicillium concentricum TaxID=293559 RepID=A0A9W9SS84_9EURO|nr:Transferase [Penicillium concentricum]KAJ5383496.1 Transferase [Penicillium concentricum]
MSLPSQTASSPSTDTIIPFHFWDDVPHTRAIGMNVTLRFDKELDPERLRNSLSRLLEIDNWRKLGARLRLDNSGKLVYHLPAKFTKDRPGFIFTAEEHDGSIKAHPLASEMPSSAQLDKNTKVRVLDGMTKYSPLVRHKNAPTGIADWLQTDIPQLVIHTVLFNDATLLTLTFQHTLMDAMGLSSLLHAWTAVLSSREEDIPPFLGFDEDLIESHTEAVSEKPTIAGIIFGKILLLRFALVGWWEKFWFPRVEDKVLMIPGKYVDELRERALQEIQELEENGKISTNIQNDEQAKAQPRPFVSESDILLALISTLLVTAQNPSRHAPVQISNIFDIRSILGLSSPGVYIGNAIMPSCSDFEAREFGDWYHGTGFECRLGPVAMKIRSALETQRTKEQVLARTALRKKTLREMGCLPLAGHPRQLGISCTNWQRAGFFGVDFGGAVVGGQTGEEFIPCRPSYVNTAGPEPLDGNGPRNMVTVTGKDSVGNWWVHIIAREEVWGQIEERARELDVQYR